MAAAAIRATVLGCLVLAVGFGLSQGALADDDLVPLAQRPALMARSRALSKPRPAPSPQASPAPIEAPAPRVRIDGDSGRSAGPREPR